MCLSLTCGCVTTGYILLLNFLPVHVGWLPYYCDACGPPQIFMMCGRGELMSSST